MPMPEPMIVKIVVYAAAFGLIGIAVGVRFRKNIGGALMGYAASQVAAMLLIVNYMGD